MAFGVPSLSNSPRCGAMIASPLRGSTWESRPRGPKVGARPSAAWFTISARPVQAGTTAAASSDAAAVRQTLAVCLPFLPCRAYGGKYRYAAPGTATPVSPLYATCSNPIAYPVFFTP